MQTLILIMSICCFFNSFFALFWTFEKKDIGDKLQFYLLNIIGITIPIIYWLKLSNIV